MPWGLRAMHDLAIIGAGPAGMAAAATACAHGLSVAVLDEQPRPGGQIYRDVERAGGARGAILGADYRAGAPLVEGLRALAGGGAGRGERVLRICPAPLSGPSKRGFASATPRRGAARSFRPGASFWPPARLSAPCRCRVGRCRA